jgi:hypothetical protein
MAIPVIDATAGGSSANCYLTVVEANAYHDGRLNNDVWDAASTDNKTIALIMATRTLDHLYTWVGARKTSTQSLEWPRVGVTARNRLQSVPDTIVPTEIKEATAEYAWQLLVEDRTTDSDLESKKITSITAGPVSLSFGEGIVAKVIPDSVYYLIPEWWGWVRSRVSATRSLSRA